MKAIRIHRTGDPQELLYEECADPIVDPEDVLIKVDAVGVNYTDILTRSGVNPPSELPWIPGQEAAGIVLKVGSEVTEIEVGDKVVSVHVPNAYATLQSAPWRNLVKIPSSIDVNMAAAAMIQGLTAHYLCNTTSKLSAGDTVLIHAGAGGVGSLLIQMAKLQGAYVFATVSNDEKKRMALESGADQVIVYTKDDFEQVINEATNNAGVDVVYDSVGRTTFEKSLNSLCIDGLLVLYGQVSGPVPPVSPRILLNRSRFLTWPSLWDHIADRPTLLKRSKDIFDWIDSKNLQVHIGTTLPLEKASTAHQLLQERKTIGKVLLTPQN